MIGKSPCYIMDIVIAVWYSILGSAAGVMSSGESRGYGDHPVPVVLFCTYWYSAKMRRHDEDGRARVRSSSLSLNYLLGRHNSMVTFPWALGLGTRAMQVMKSRQAGYRSFSDKVSR
jgi:hypothetical protein